LLCRPPGGIIVIYCTKYQSGWQPGLDEAATPKGKGVKVQTKTYTTEKEAKKAAARDYRPAIVRLPNGVAMGVSMLEISFRRERVR
jgi:hypothetical protein